MSDYSITTLKLRVDDLGRKLKAIQEAIDLKLEEVEAGRIDAEHIQRYIDDLQATIRHLEMKQKENNA